MRKKLLAVLLSLAMVLTLLPTWAIAAGNVVEYTGEWGSLEMSFLNASDGDTIKLMADVTNNVHLPQRDLDTEGTRTVTLDLNGRTITGSLEITRGYIVTIKDGVGTGRIVSNNYGAHEGSTWDPNGTLVVDWGADVTIEDGTFEGQMPLFVSAADCEIVGGNFYTVAENGAVLSVQDFISEKTPAEAISANVELKGGNFNSADYRYLTFDLDLPPESNVTSTGYSFTEDDRDIIPAGYTVHNDGEGLYAYYIDDNGTTPTGGGDEPTPTGGNVAQVYNGAAGPLYTTLQAAINAASNGDYIVMIADVNESVEINKGLKIFLGGHTLRGNGDAPAITVDAGEASVNISGGGTGDTATAVVNGNGHEAIYVKSGTVSTTVMSADLDGDPNTGADHGAEAVGTVADYYTSGTNVITVDAGASLEIYNAGHYYGHLNVKEGGACLIAAPATFTEDVPDEYLEDISTHLPDKCLACEPLAATDPDYNRGYRYRVALKDESTPGGDEPTGNVLTVGTNGTYTSLEEAMNAAQASDVVKLVSDVDVTGTVQVHNTNAFTLDLNGHTLTAANEMNAMIAFNLIGTGVDLTICDSGGNGKIICNELFSLYEAPQAKLAITGGTFECRQLMNLTNDSELSISGGAFSCTDPMQVCHGSRCEISGGRFLVTPPPGDNDPNRRNALLFLQFGSALEVSNSVVITGGEFNYKTCRGMPSNFDFSLDELLGPDYVLVDNGEGSTYRYAIVRLGAAQIGSTSYDTLEEAVAHAKRGDVIRLMDNVTLDTRVDIDTKITLDLNGYTIKPADSLDGFGATTTNRFRPLKSEGAGSNGFNTGVIAVLHGGDLTIEDSSTGKTGTIDANGKTYAAICMTVPGETNDGNAAKLTVNGGTLQGWYYGIVGNGSAGRGNTQIVINGGTIKGIGDDPDPDEGSHGIYHPQQNNSTLTVNGGEIEGYSTAIEMRSGTLNITGGTFTARAPEYSCNPNGNGTTTTGAAIAISQHTTKQALAFEISGGTFTGVKAISESNPQNNDPAPQVAMSITDGTFNGGIEITDKPEVGFVTGGTFDADSGVEAYIDSDFCEMTPTTDGKYQIKLEEDVQIVAQVIDENGIVLKRYANDSWDFIYNAIAFALEHDAVLELLPNDDVLDYGFEFGTIEAEYEKTLKVKSNGATISATVYNGAVIEVLDRPDMVTNTKVRTETVLTNANENGKFNVGNDVTVNIVATDASGNTLESYEGAYFVVEYNSAYLTVAEGMDEEWDTSTPGKLVFWDMTGKSNLTGGVVTKLEFTAEKSCVDGTPVTITTADLLADMDTAVCGCVYASTIETPAALVKIALQTNEWLTNPSMPGDGTAPGKYVYTGNPVEATAENKGVAAHYSAADAEPTVAYYKVTDDVETPETPQNVGHYKAVFTVAETDDYTGLSYECEFDIIPATRDLNTEGMAQTGLTYTGESFCLLANGVPTQMGLKGEEVALTDIKYTIGAATKTYDTYTKVKASAAGDYIVHITAKPANTANYVFNAAEVHVTISNPDYKVAITEYVTGYSMVYVFTNGEAHFKYDGNAMFNVKDFGYKCTEVGGTEHDAVLDTNGTEYTYVYARLVQGAAASNKVAPASRTGANANTDKKRDGSFLSLNSDESIYDINYSHEVGIDDAVLAAATYNLNENGFAAYSGAADLAAKVKACMAHIVRADVDRNGTVAILDVDSGLPSDVLMIKEQITTE